MLEPATGAALIAAGLLSVLVFPLAALSVIRGKEATPGAVTSEPLSSTGGVTSQA